MSAELAKRAVELVWKQWTALGVNGMAKLPEQAIDLEALIAFTPFLYDEDPRLVEESCDWCVQFGHDYASMSRLKQILRLMPPRDGQLDADPVAILLGTHDGRPRALSGKSRRPKVRQPNLLQLRSRCVFGVGARADLLARLVSQPSDQTRSRMAEMRPSGYTKQAISAVMSELTQGGVLKKHDGPTPTYSTAKPKALRSLLAPLPPGRGTWAEPFALAAHVLTTWRRCGTRKTYVVELVRVLAEERNLMRAVGPTPELVGHPAALRHRIEHWALGLLVDEIWTYEWNVGGKDALPDILEKLDEDLVAEVQSDVYPVGMTELSDFSIHVTDPRKGLAEFTVNFSGEHYKDDFPFDGHLDGEISFEPSAASKSELVNSVSIRSVRAHFNIDDDADRE